MISSSISRVQYTGNGATSVYSYGCQIRANTDLVVVVRLIATGVETTLTLTTDYTVGSIGQSTGNITLVNASQLWLDGSGHLLSTYVIVIRRVRPLTQPTSIRNQGAFYAGAHEDTFDNLVMLDQQQQTQIDRSVAISNTLQTSDFNPVLPNDVAGKISAIPCTNSSGNGWAAASLWPLVSDLGAAVTAAAQALASQLAAAASETAAALSETNAATSETNAAASATSASASSISAAASAAAAAASSGAPTIVGTRAAPSTITTAIPFSGTAWSNVIFVTAGSAVALSANPQIVAGSAVGQTLRIVMPVTAANSISIATGTGVDAPGALVLEPGGTAEYLWDGTNWFETNRRDA